MPVGVVCQLKPPPPPLLLHPQRHGTKIIPDTRTLQAPGRAVVTLFLSELWEVRMLSWASTLGWSTWVTQLVDQSDPTLTLRLLEVSKPTRRSSQSSTVGELLLGSGLSSLQPTVWLVYLAPTSSR